MYLIVNQLSILIGICIKFGRRDRQVSHLLNAQINKKNCNVSIQ